MVQQREADPPRIACQNWKLITEMTIAQQAEARSEANEADGAGAVAPPWTEALHQAGQMRGPAFELAWTRTQLVQPARVAAAT